MIMFRIEGEAVPKARPRVVSRGKYVSSYTPQKTVDYENKVKKAFTEKYPDFEPLDCSLRMGVQIERKIPKSFNKSKREKAINGEIKPTTKPDIDNIVKSIADALNGIAYNDDSQITTLSAQKRYAEEPITTVFIWRDV